MFHSIVSRFSTMTLVALSITAALTGCAERQLIPISSEQRVDDMKRAAIASVNDVSVLVQDAEWPTGTDISEEVTPLRVSIRNNSDQPVRIAYSEFALVSPDGVISQALPLYAIEGTVSEPIAVDEYGPITAPGFAYSNFAVAPYIADLYPGITPATSPFFYDPYYYGYFGDPTYWVSTTLPTPAMHMSALPEGVLSPGGSMDGWLYFKKIENAQRVVFRADIVDSSTGEQMGEIRVPFAVE